VAGLKSPCLIIVGEVVRLHDTLAWYDPARTDVVPPLELAALSA
jgi:hypothetical protein